MTSHCSHLKSPSSSPKPFFRKQKKATATLCGYCVKKEDSRRSWGETRGPLSSLVSSSADGHLPSRFLLHFLTCPSTESLFLPLFLTLSWTLPPGKMMLSKFLPPIQNIWMTLLSLQISRISSSCRYSGPPIIFPSIFWHLSSTPLYYKFLSRVRQIYSYPQYVLFFYSSIYLYMAVSSFPTYHKFP